MLSLSPRAHHHHIDRVEINAYQSALLLLTVIDQSRTVNIAFRLDNNTLFLTLLFHYEKSGLL